MVLHLLSCKITELLLYFYLSDDYGLFHLSSGEILKKVIKNNTSLGKEINNYINKGELVPDNIGKLL